MLDGAGATNINEIGNILHSVFSSFTPLAILWGVINVTVQWPLSDHLNLQRMWGELCVPDTLRLTGGAHAMTTLVSYVRRAESKIVCPDSAKCTWGEGY